MNPAEYLAELQSALVASPIVTSFTIVDERVLPDSGYFRVRLRLRNEDFVELAEFFVFNGDTCHPVDYRFQWMDETQTQLRRRWDNVPHFLSLPNAPYHVHDGDEANVKPSNIMSTLDVLQLIEHECAV